MFVVGSLVGLTGYWLGWYAFCLLRGPSGLGVLDLIIPSRVGTVDAWLAGGPGGSKGQGPVQPGAPGGEPAPPRGGRLGQTPSTPGNPGGGFIVPSGPNAGKTATNV